MTGQCLRRARFCAKPSSWLGSRPWAGRGELEPAPGPILLSFHFFSSLKFLLVGLGFHFNLSDSAKDPKPHYTLKALDLHILSLLSPLPR